MYIKEMDRNRYLFQFYHELDIARVIEGSPWTFGRFQLVFTRLKEGENPRTINIDKIDLWVQLHDMSTGFMSLKVVTDIGNYIGRFIESDVNNFVGVWRDYLRVRVSIDLNKPLQRRMKLKRNDANWCLVNFKYEDIPTFCFIYEMIGHSEKFCERIFDTPPNKIVKPYGAWMRAEPRRRHQTIGAKWLRQGGGSPASSPMEETQRKDVKVVTEDVAVGDYNPGKSGIQVVSMIPQNGVSGGENIGSGVIVGETSSNVTTGINLKNNQARESIELSEDSGLEITVSKRRRMEEPKLSGPIEKIGDEDADMLDTQNNGNMVPKNLLQAGAALRARQSL